MIVDPPEVTALEGIPTAVIASAAHAEKITTIALLRRETIDRRRDAPWKTILPLHPGDPDMMTLIVEIILLPPRIHMPQDVHTTGLRGIFLPRGMAAILASHILPEIMSVDTGNSFPSLTHPLL
jgi:hypothetical protein